MSLLQLVFSEGEPRALPIRVCGVPAGAALEIPSPDSYLPSTQTRECGRTEQTTDMAEQDFERQLRQIENMALQHYPEDEAGRNAYMVELLKQRLREYAAKFVALEVRKQ